MVRERKPTSPATSVDEQIRRARKRGLFDDLEGEGEPLRDLREVEDPTWWGKKLLAREQLSILPPALEVKHEVEELLDSLPTMRDEGQVRERLEELNEKIRRINSHAHAGPPTHQALLDVEARVAAWRLARAEADAREGEE
ncbi:MAG: hypothetical protein CL910_01350 [Deltaproteobacteria bacterium]|jgi:hypothetical protein|nr:hypothetical protein [Deltaproteobacteria bacterium]